MTAPAPTRTSGRAVLANRNFAIYFWSATISNAEEFGEWIQTLRGETTVVIEDVAFPMAHLAAGTAELGRLFRVHGYDEGIIFGHALEGRLEVYPGLRYSAFLVPGLVMAVLGLALRRFRRLVAPLLSRSTGPSQRATAIRACWGDQVLVSNAHQPAR